ncbi:MAG: hypothetical protein ACXWF8_12155 [Methylobacter sp.]
MSHASNQQHIIEYVSPALSEVEQPLLRKSLIGAFHNEAESLKIIEDSFKQITGDYHSQEKLKYFFRSWMMTNNSAMCISGLGNRMTMQTRDGSEIKDKDELFQTIASLHRISDEDLGVGNGLLHWDLFYRMATSICEADDWQSSRYLTAEAEAFKRWKDAQSLKDPDLMIGLLTTLIHEIYTHGEVEYIEPMFHRWLAVNSNFDETERRRNLFWITAHCNGTETAHFGHAQDATTHYCRALDIELSDYAMETIFRDYLQRKARAMESITHVLNFVPVKRMMYRPATVQHMPATA